MAWWAQNKDWLHSRYTVALTSSSTGGSAGPAPFPGAAQAGGSGPAPAGAAASGFVAGGSGVGQGGAPTSAVVGPLGAGALGAAEAGAGGSLTAAAVAGANVLPGTSTTMQHHLHAHLQHAAGLEIGSSVPGSMQGGSSVRSSFDASSSSPMHSPMATLTAPAPYLGAQAQGAGSSTGNPQAVQQAAAAAGHSSLVAAALAQAGGWVPPGASLSRRDSGAGGEPHFVGVRSPSGYNSPGGGSPMTSLTTALTANAILGGGSMGGGSGGGGLMGLPQEALTGSLAQHGLGSPSYLLQPPVMADMGSAGALGGPPGLPPPAPMLGCASPTMSGRGTSRLSHGTGAPSSGNPEAQQQQALTGGPGSPGGAMLPPTGAPPRPRIVGIGSPGLASHPVLLAGGVAGGGGGSSVGSHRRTLSGGTSSLPSRDSGPAHS